MYFRVQNSSLKTVLPLLGNPTGGDGHTGNKLAYCLKINPVSMCKKGIFSAKPSFLPFCIGSAL
jgi:hypothetical protein